MMLRRIGFLLCEHYDEDSQMTEFWLLLNPKQDETVSRDDVLKFLHDLITMAVEIMLEYFQ